MAFNPQSALIAAQSGQQDPEPSPPDEDQDDSGYIRNAQLQYLSRTGDLEGAKEIDTREEAEAAQRKIAPDSPNPYPGPTRTTIDRAFYEGTGVDYACLLYTSPSPRDS